MNIHQEFSNTGIPMSSSALFQTFKTSAAFRADRFPANDQLLDAPVDTPKPVSAEELQHALFATVDKSEMHASQIGNAQSLVNGKAFAVVTGQQCGVFGGPMFTLYKAATAVAYARELSQRYGVPVVPVFWVEDNDHDLHEIAIAHALSEGKVLTRDWYDFLPEHRTIAAHWTVTDEMHKSMLQWYKASSGPFAQQSLEMILDAYAVGNSMSEGFAHIVQSVFGHSGMLIVSAAQLRQQGLFTSLLQDVIHNTSAVEQRYQEAVQALSTFDLQPTAESAVVNAFAFYQGKRYRLTKDSDKVRIQGLPDVPISDAGVTLGPNVLTRNLCQDSVFPTLAYISGPGELSYQSLLREQYERAGIPMPAFIARKSAVLVDSPTRKFAEDERIWKLLFDQRGQHLYEEELFGDMAKDIISPISKNITLEYKSLQRSVGNIDPTLEATVLRIERDAHRNLKDLHSRIRRAQRKQHETSIQRFERAQNSVFPLTSPQERILTLGTLLPRIGLEGVQRIFDAMSSNVSNEQVFIHI